MMPTEVSASHRQRTLVVVRNACLMILGKGGIYIAGLITARMLVEYGGVESYGLWAPCAQALMWVGLLDLGLGLGLQNMASHAKDDADRRQVAETAGAAFAALVALAVVLAVAGILTRAFIPESLLFPLPSILPGGLHESASVVVLIAILGIAAGLAAQIPFRLIAGVQGHGTLTTIQGVVALGVVPAIPLSQWLGLHWTFGLAVVAITPLLVPLVGGWILLGRPEFNWARPRWNGLEPLRRVVSASSALFVSQLAAILVFQTNIVIIGRLGGLTEAALMDACLRILTVPLMAQSIVLAAIWPALAQAHAQGDHAWVERTYRRGVKMTVGLMILCLLIAAATPWLTPLLLGTHGPRPHWSLVAGLFCFVCCSLWGGLHAQCLNALGLVRGAAVLAVLQAALNLPAIILGYLWGGLDVVSWASVAASLLTAVPGLTWLWRHRG